MLFHVSVQNICVVLSILYHKTYQYLDQLYICRRVLLVSIVLIYKLKIKPEQNQTKNIFTEAS